MGRGDKRTFKGKVFRGSFGKSRPRTDKKTTGNSPAAGSSASTSTAQQQRRK
jgi:30S ribosomal protein S31